jgi:hypothetical protein
MIFAGCVFDVKRGSGGTSFRYNSIIGEIEATC